MVQARRRSPLTVPTDRRSALTHLADLKAHYQQQARNWVLGGDTAVQKIRRNRALTTQQRHAMLRKIEANVREKINPIRIAMEDERAAVYNLLNSQLFSGRAGRDGASFRNARDRAQDLIDNIVKAGSNNDAQQAMARLDREVLLAIRSGDAEALQALTLIASDHHMPPIQDFSNVFNGWRELDAKAGGLMDAIDVYESAKPDAMDALVFGYTVSLTNRAQQEADAEMAREAWEEAHGMLQDMGLADDDSGAA
jgi:hypothetical protein